MSSEKSAEVGDGVTVSETVAKYPIRTLAERFILAGLALATMRLGQPVLLPLVSAAILTLLVLPFVRFLESFRLPRAIAAGLVLSGLVAALVFAVLQLQSPAATWMERAPENLAELQVKLQELREPVEKVVQAADQMEELAQGGGEGVQQDVAVSNESEQSFSEMLIDVTWQTLTFLVLVVVLVFFMLVGRERMLAKTVMLVPDANARKRVLSAASQIRTRLSTFVVTMTLINLGLGAAVGTSLWLLGYSNPILWGVMVAVLNYVPYLGSATGIVIVGFVGLVTFDTLGPALGAMGAYLALTSIEGTMVSPALLSSRLSLDPVVTLVGILIMGFTWGVPGVLLTVPVLVCIKVLAEHHGAGTSIAAVVGEGHDAVPVWQPDGEFESGDGNS